MQAKRLNRKDIKKIEKLFLQQFGYFLEKDEYDFFATDKGKIFVIKITNRLINRGKIRLNRQGFYFCEKKKDHEFIRLSMQGAQMLVNLAKLEGKLDILLENTKLVELNEAEMVKYMKGEDLEVSESENFPSLLLSFKQEVFAWAQIKEGILLNYVPKAFRGSVIL